MVGPDVHQARQIKRFPTPRDASSSSNVAQKGNSLVGAVQRVVVIVERSAGPTQGITPCDWLMRPHVLCGFPLRRS
jgi:hypothetical protein